MQRRRFREVCEQALRSGAPAVLAPVGRRILADQLTPVLAYRRLVAEDDRLAPSFLFESVEQGGRQGRYSILGARPALDLWVREGQAELTDRRAGTTRELTTADPLALMRTVRGEERLAIPEGLDLPDAALGGWFGYAGYDAVRYAEPGKVGFEQAPADDRGLADVQFGFYDRLCVFDHARRIVHLVALARVDEAGRIDEAYDEAVAALDAIETQLLTRAKPLAAGRLEIDAAAHPQALRSNLSAERHRAMVERAREYIRAGDIFQVVLGQRFERDSAADPFDVYRALRAVNPSPYMGYLQARGCILVASSPEILCRVEPQRQGGCVVTNRPLAGTRRRGVDEEEDEALARELLADPKERAEHIMLVDLGRNDVGRVSQPASVALEKVMAIERYSHVMHISSTVRGRLRPELDALDALRAALPAGTVSGAPKIRAMQIIDELEPLRRGPYGGGFGYLAVDGALDMALALRTIVVPVERKRGDRWVYHLQASGGIVADSDPEAERRETENKAAALARAIDAAEQAFGAGGADG